MDLVSRGRLAMSMYTLLFASACAHLTSLAAPGARNASPVQPVAETVALWRRHAPDILGDSIGSAPLVILFDERMAYHIDLSADPSVVSTVAHRGVLTLPNGDSLAVAPRAWTSVDHAGRPFIAIAAPSLWRRTADWRDDPDREWLFARVLLHELTHAAQANSVLPRARALQAVRGGPLDDDFIQRHFGRAPAFARSVEHETELFWLAAHASDSARAAAFESRARALMRQRRDHFYGSDSVWAEVEALYLEAEGAAEWTAFEILRRARGLSLGQAMARIRRTRLWSQDEGLAMYLASGARRR